jgi:hypothetical protein
MSHRSRSHTVTRVVSLYMMLRDMMLRDIVEKRTLRDYFSLLLDSRGSDRG